MDIFSKVKRSEIMRLIRGQDTKPELAIRFAAHRQRFNRREGTLQHKLLSVALEAYRLGEISKSKLKDVASELEISNEELRAFLGGIEVETESAKEGVHLPG